MSEFPSMKAARLLAVLKPQPLGYQVVRQRGSHRTLRAPGMPPLKFAFHDRRTLSPGEVRDVLVSQVGLAEPEALRLI